MLSYSNSLVYVLSALAAAGIAYVLLKSGDSKSSTVAVSATASNTAVLSSSEYRKFRLIKKTQISHNTSRYRFEIPSSNTALGLPIGRHIQVMASVNGKELSRSYTPTSTDKDMGFFEIVVKTYPNGAISSHLDQMNIGDTIDVRGPRGTFQYSPNMVRAFGIIAGGTGITPMYQIIQHVLNNPEDKTQIDVIFANVNTDDILLKEQLDMWALEHDNFRVHYVLNNPPEGWTGGVGFVTKEMIENWLPAPASDIKILLCGPPPMIKAMDANLTEIGYEKTRIISKPDDQVFKF